MTPMKLVAEREKSWPFYWVVRDDSGAKVDRDQYSNDLRERWPHPDYDLIFIQDFAP
jgi:hypothetical protein